MQEHLHLRKHSLHKRSNSGCYSEMEIVIQGTSVFLYNFVVIWYFPAASSFIIESSANLIPN